jgi:hypothetical protein
VAVEKVRPLRRQPARRWLARLAWLAVPLVVVGEAGHHLLDRFGQAVTHHFFHIVFAGSATVAFVAYVAIDVRRHGWPEFSWRTRMEPGRNRFSR